MVVALRLALLLLAAPPTNCAATQLMPEAEDLWVLGHLAVPARAYTLLASAARLLAGGPGLASGGRAASGLLWRGR